jgi:rfaE bifunctional protein nucleotidyltransferase chain/domain
MSSAEPEAKEHETYADFAKGIREYGRNKHPSSGYERLIFVNGIFDILHLGHLQTIVHARTLAGPRGAVIVGINDDKSTRRLKGRGRPLNDERSRALLLLHLRHVDHVITFAEDTPLELIQALCPDVIVKGGDYRPDQVVGKELAMVSIAPYDENYSTTELVKKARKRGPRKAP